MKSTVIYYSYSGNTKKVANILSDYLSSKGEVNILELRAQDESKSFFRQGARAFRHKKAVIEPVQLDLSDYDLVCMGTPVWAFGPAPAMNTYLDECFGIRGKDIVLFTTYGSGTGNNRCLKFMESALSKKGARKFKRFSVQQFKVEDKTFVLSRIKEALP